jgi:hypothetical protein
MIPYEVTRMDEHLELDRLKLYATRYMDTPVRVRHDVDH